MAGLRILHYMVDIGYSENTRVYAVEEQLGGDLQMRKIFDHQAPMEFLIEWYMGLDIRRPIVFVEEPRPQTKEFFRSKGIRTR